MNDKNDMLKRISSLERAVSRLELALCRMETGIDSSRYENFYCTDCTCNPDHVSQCPRPECPQGLYEGE